MMISESMMDVPPIEILATSYPGGAAVLLFGIVWLISAIVGLVSWVVGLVDYLFGFFKKIEWLDL